MKALLAEFEGSRKLELETVLHQLSVTKDDMKKKLLLFMHLLKPWQLLELMTEKSNMDGSFERSETWMNIEYGNKVVITYNIDKGGNDITVSIRLLNRKEGNYMKHTYPSASVG